MGKQNNSIPSLLLQFPCSGAPVEVVYRFSVKTSLYLFDRLFELVITSNLEDTKMCSFFQKKYLLEIDRRMFVSTEENGNIRCT